MKTDYLNSVIKQFEYYKLLGDKTLSQLPEGAIFWQYNVESNSIATIIKHLHGNMLSRWTDFLTADGEKEWRNRDGEFEIENETEDHIMMLWEDGWQCFFKAVKSLTPDDLERIIYIRNMGHTVMEAINRQLAHYPYHVGQMIFIGKMVCGAEWASLSIPKGKSNEYNADKFAQPKRKAHFTDEILDKKDKE